MNRIVYWHIPHPGEPLPTFYMERDYIPEKVRIYAENAPINGSFEVDIRDDGTTIFANRAEPYTTLETDLSEISYNTLATSTFKVGERVHGTSAKGHVVTDTGLRDISTSVTTGAGIMALNVLTEANFTVGETITGQTSGATAVILNFYRGSTVQTVQQDEAVNKVTLPEGENLEENAEDFPSAKNTIEEGSILTCHILKTGGASNVTVQLELLPLGEGD